MLNKHHKLASLLFWRWQFWHEPRWQKNARWSLGSWMISAALFAVVLNNWVHGLILLFAWSLFNDGVNYVVNKKEIFPDRKVNSWYSGSMCFAVGIVCFAYHKATLLLLATVFGLGIYWIIAIQAAIGILENPVRYMFNTNVAFAEQNQGDKV